jgi:hypothetical protein
MVLAQIFLKVKIFQIKIGHNKKTPLKSSVQTQKFYRFATKFYGSNTNI